MSFCKVHQNLVYYRNNNIIVAKNEAALEILIPYK